MNSNQIKQEIVKSKPLKISTPPNTPTASISRSFSTKSPKHNHETESKEQSPYSVEHSITKNQYKPVAEISQTLQGSIWQVSQNGNTYIIKVTSKELHNKHVTNLNGPEINVSENIVQEATILKYLTSNYSPKSFAKYIDFFDDELNFFLVMEYAGSMSLFDFVKRCHQYINKKVLSIEAWHAFCKIAIKQLIHLIDWLHTMHCCHLDISLENVCIDNVMVAENTETKTITFLPGFQLKIIDFGLSEVFYSKNEYNEIDFRCNKWVGKSIYKAPEIYNKHTFDARLADCWSLSILFFIMIVGNPPWSNPSKNDVAFHFIMNGHLNELLVQWGKMDHVSPNILNLFSLLFQYEKYRLNINEIKRHPFLL